MYVATLGLRLRFTSARLAATRSANFALLRKQPHRFLVIIIAFSCAALTMAVAGPTNIAGATGDTAATTASADPGTYALTEFGGPADYTASAYSRVVDGGTAESVNSDVLVHGNTAVCTVTNTFVPLPKLTLMKQSIADTPLPLHARQVITYEFVVTNMRNVTVLGVGINKTDVNGDGPITFVSPPSGSVMLAPGAYIKFTASYTVSQADVDTLQ